MPSHALNVPNSNEEQREVTAVFREGKNRYAAVFVTCYVVAPLKTSKDNKTRHEFKSTTSRKNNDDIRRGKN